MKRKRIDWTKVQALYDSGKTLKEISIELDYSLNTLRSGSYKKRGKLKLDPNHYWTPKRREEYSKRQAKRMLDNPDKHPNRILANNRSRMSYPEKLVYDFLKKEGIEFEHNYYVEPYWIDFIAGGVGIEIDGRYWHNREEDSKRDLHLREMGIGIFRFEAARVIKEGPEIVVFEALADKVTPERLEELKVRQKEIIDRLEAEREARRPKCSNCGEYISNHRSSLCIECYRRRSCRIQDEEIKEKLDLGLNYSEIAREIGISPKAVQKRAKALGVESICSTRRLSEDKILGLKKLVASGSTFAEVAKILGVDSSTVMYHAKRLGLKSSYDREATKKVTLSDDELRELFNSGKTYKELSEILGITHSNVARWKKKFK